MGAMEVEFLSRIQFALTAGFHFLFPPISIGLALYIVIVEAAWLFSGRECFRCAAKFFLKLFAVIFAAGVATGIVLEFEFGTNWPVYSNFVGDVFGSPLAIEAVFAFFMESVFLGVSLWGWEKTGRKAHFFATLAMCAGAHLSAVWIISANSFMQTPSGFELEFSDPATGAVRALAEGSVPSPEQISSTRAVITDFWDMALSASMPDRFFHTVSASWLCGAFFALGVCGWMILRGKRVSFSRPCALLALCYAVLSSLLMLVTGHSSAKTLAATQPEKLAAFEGHYRTCDKAPLYLFGWVDEGSRSVAGVKVDGFLSLLAFGSSGKVVEGLEDLPSGEFLRKIYPGASDESLKDIRPSYWAPVNFSFQTFRVMVYAGAAIFLFSAWGICLWLSGKIFDSKAAVSRAFWFCSMFSMAMPMIACQAGWAAAEVGRQPWIVWHILKTSDAVTTAAGAMEILLSTLIFSSVFAVVAAVAIFVVLEKIRRVREDC